MLGQWIQHLKFHVRSCRSLKSAYTLFKLMEYEPQPLHIVIGLSTHPFFRRSVHNQFAFKSYGFLYMAWFIAELLIFHLLTQQTEIRSFPNGNLHLFIKFLGSPFVKFVFAEDVIVFFAPTSKQQALIPLRLKFNLKIYIEEDA